MGLAKSVVSMERKTLLGRPSLISGVNRNTDYPAGTGLVLVSIKRQNYLGGTGLIRGLNQKPDYPA